MTTSSLASPGVPLSSTTVTSSGVSPVLVTVPLKGISWPDCAAAGDPGPQRAAVDDHVVAGVAGRAVVVDDGHVKRGLAGVGHGAAEGDLLAGLRGRRGPRPPACRCR